MKTLIIMAALFALATPALAHESHGRPIPSTHPIKIHFPHNPRP